MLKVIEENDAIEVTDGTEEPSTRTKIIMSIVGIVAMTIILNAIGFFILFVYAVVLWLIWRPFKSTSYLFDRKTLKVYRLETKKQKRSLKELAHFSELGKFRIIEVQESEDRPDSEGMSFSD
jgi:hypothetical protein